MYLVRPMRGTASELGLKQVFRLLSNTLGMQNNVPLPVGPKLEIEQPSG